MSQKTCTILSTLTLICNLCVAQVDSAFSGKPVKPAGHFSFQSRYVVRSGTNCFEKELFQSRSTSALLFRPAYPGFIQSPFSGAVDPLNPWHAANPVEALTSGTLYYLVQRADKKFSLRR